jgi:hypothetical protein
MPTHGESKQKADEKVKEWNVVKSSDRIQCKQQAGRLHNKSGIGEIKQKFLEAGT